MMKYKCVTNGFKIRGYRVNTSDSVKHVTVISGDVLDCVGEYIVKDGVALCHNDSILAKYHFRKVGE